MAQINKPNQYFNTKLYTGTGSSQAITGVDFQPDMVWIKDRTVGFDHVLQDSVRGTTKIINSNQTYAEFTNANSITSFNSDGFTTGSYVATNQNTTPYVSWNWLGANGTASNTDGSITSTVSANTTSGFSIVSYTGNETSGATVGHGLGSKPAMMIFKERNGITGWVVYQHKNTSAPATEYLQLNSTNATGDYAGYFNDTEPTSSVFTLGNDTGINQSGDTYIAYCFAEKKGFSKFGSYIGNGNANGTFVYTGFKPAFVMIKATDLVKNWLTFDNLRLGYNGTGTNKQLHPNTSGAESSGNGTTLDILSNGFKTRTTDSDENGSGNTYIYMAFAENPLVGTNNIPATAR